MKFILLLFLSVYIFSCGEISNTNVLPSAPFFDLTDYMDQEIIRLKNLSEITKTISFNTKKEVLKIDLPSLEKELAIFKNADINKIAWIDKYEVDSLLNKQNEVEKLIYKANEKSLRTQLMEITFNKNLVDHIYIENNSKSLISGSFQTLKYFPKKGFEIKSKQDMLIIEDANLSIEVSF